jgi:hypothetical protein
VDRVIRGLATLPAVVALAVLATLAACAPPSPTELVLVVDLGDGLEVPRDLTYATIRVSTASGELLREGVAFTGPDAQRFPLTLGLRQASGRADHVDFRIEAFSGATRPAITRLVSTEFVPGARRLVYVRLDRACLARDCEPGRTCDAGACLEPWIEPATLPAFEGELPDADVREDAGPSELVDAGLDASREDAPDAPSPIDVGLDAARDADLHDAPELLDATSCRSDAFVRVEPPECPIVRPVTRPSCGDGDDGVVRTFALIDPVYDQSAGVWATDSFDLDALCTSASDPAPVTECLPPTDDLPPTDGPGGVDNVLGQTVYPTILTLVPDFQYLARLRALAGHAVPIVQISGWSGGDDDPRVRVVVATALDILPAGEPPPDPAHVLDNPIPRWDGLDEAYLGNDSFVAGEPTIVDDNAYVSGRVLVARLPDRSPLDFPAARGPARVRLTEPRIVLTLAADGASITSAVVLGRWSYTDMLAHLGDLGICPRTAEGDAYLATFDLVVRRVMDVRAAAGTGGPGVACDAISTALPFAVGRPVRWAGVLALSAGPTGCP